MSASRRDAPPVAADAHEWLSFEDPDEDRTWIVDVTFLASRWECIFARGCQGVLTGPAPELVQGCCSYGAHFTGDEDIERVETAAATLTPAQWQWRSKGLGRRGIVRRNRSGERVTRLVDGACIFLNRPGWPGGPGCSLHRAALERGIEPLELKPDVCWQLPLRREDLVADDGHVTSTLTEWRRRNWGKGGRDFHWWCTEAPEAFVGPEPVYRSMRAEIVAAVGSAVYERIEAFMDERVGGLLPVPLPHPSVRHRTAGTLSEGAADVLGGRVRSRGPKSTGRPRSPKTPNHPAEGSSARAQ